jgi:transcriptional regulator of NAD metabolism
MYNLAAKGDPRAQKEYAAWLRKLDKAKRAYQEAYDNEEIEQLAAYGYEVRQFIVSYFIIGTITGR